MKYEKKIILPNGKELVTVTGTFEVYKENGYFYCVLKDAYFS